MKFPDLPGAAGDSVVQFTFHDITPADLFAEVRVEEVSAWLTAVAKTRGRRIAQLDYVFCGDDYLAELNVAHLDHDTLTDIITFDLTDDQSGTCDEVEGECYISQERVLENASGFGESPNREMLRVIAHGLLHLCGLGDKSAAEARTMRSAEDTALDNWDARPTVER